MNQSRPLLLGNVRANLINLLQERTPIYEKLSNIIIETSGIPPEQCAEQLAVFMKHPGVTHDRSH
jgi:shikimate kinase